MKKNNILKDGIVLGIIALFIGAAAILPIATANRSVPDPDLSSIELTNQLYPGLNTCPLADYSLVDGTLYRYIRVTVLDANGGPMSGIPASYFDIVINPTGLIWYGALSCSIISDDTETDANGQIDFSLYGDTSIIGNCSITISVIGIQINDWHSFSFKSFDNDASGGCTLADFSRFGACYNGVSWRNNFNWDPGNIVTLSDFSMFGAHYNHLHP